MKIGTTDINNVYIGSTTVNTVYIGTTKIFPNVSLLLDTYSGAEVAYSLRKLRTAYGGSAIRVRRSSDNTEQDIGFSGNDLDTSALTTFCSGTDGFVTTWYDQANSNNLVQTTAANQPQIVSSGSVLLQNSKPTLRFDGSNDWLDVSITKPARFSVYSVLKADATSTIYNAFGSVANTGAAATGWGNLRFDTSNKNRTYWGDGTNYRIYQTTATSQDANQNIYSVLYDSGLNIYIYKNNSSLGLSEVAGGTATTSGGTSYKFAAGRTGENAGTYFDGDIQELIVYTSYQGTNNSGINGNMNTYWSVY